MVDEYLKYEFEDVIGGGLKTKFKVLICLMQVHECKTGIIRVERRADIVRRRQGVEQVRVDKEACAVQRGEDEVAKQHLQEEGEDDKQVGVGEQEVGVKVRVGEAVKEEPCDGVDEASGVGDEV